MHTPPEIIAVDVETLRLYEGNYADERQMTAYVSAETHTWIQKAVDICGLGANSIRWINKNSQTG